MRTTAQLVAIRDLDGLTKADRWTIISEIDQHIDHLQRCQKVLHNARLDYEMITAEIRGLRAKRMQVWLSFNPKFRSLVRLAAA